MLKYNIKINCDDKYDELQIEGNLFLSPDMSFISGVTSYNPLLDINHKIHIELDDSENFIEAYIDTFHVTRQGFVVYPTQFIVENYLDRKCIRFKDGKYVMSDSKGNITIDKTKYDCSSDECKYITIPIVYWIEDNKLKIGDITYNIDFSLDYDKDSNDYINNDLKYITLKNGNRLSINNSNKSDWKKVTKFIIHKDSNYLIDLDYICCSKKAYYFEYGYDNNVSLKNYFNDNKDVITYDGKTFKLTDNFLAVNKSNGNEVYNNVKYSWVNTFISNYLCLYVDDNKYSFNVNDNILVESKKEVPCRCEEIDKNGDVCYIFCGQKYYKEKNRTIDFIILNNKEYEITYTKEKWGINNLNIENDENFKYGYVKLNNNDDEPIPILVNYNEDKAYIYSIINSVRKEEVKLNKYEYVIINNQNHIIKSYNKKNIKINYINISMKKSFLLYIDEIISNNMLICHIANESNELFSEYCSDITSNYNLYNFYLVNKIFSINNILKSGAYDNLIFSKKNEKISLFSNLKYINIPLLTDNDAYSELNKDFNIKKDFVNDIFNKSINKITDMEKNVYYPTRYDFEENTFQDIDEIRFNLHFRTRNLESWKINEDFYKGNNTNKKHDWNFLDYYNINGNNGIGKIDVDENSYSKYQQPSDLLYFLNFTNNDVFYRKKKIDRSFLRLSFFNSNDIENQSLLYTCTIFMDENKLFKKYIDYNGIKNERFIDVTDNLDSDGNHFVTNRISVSVESIDNMDRVVFDENKRISATISVKNKYNMENSSEGFYLYIFKDYCEKLHEEPIYMKVDFNHAGEGRTVNLTVPFKIITDDYGNDKYILYDFKNNDDINEFKEGIPLSELNKHLFIPLESVYDSESNRYCYFMPKWLDKSNKDKLPNGEINEKNISKIIYNLYEIKIKDES